jgi:hypothetical protein
LSRHIDFKRGGVGTGGRRVGNLEGRRRSLGYFFIFISYHDTQVWTLSLYGLVSGMELSEKNPGGVKINKNP